MTTAPRIINNRADLFAALCDDGLHYHTLVRPNSASITGVIRAVEREDGSGRKFNVTIATGPRMERQTVFVQFSE
jgi:hypothetical protein